MCEIVSAMFTCVFLTTMVVVVVVVVVWLWIPGYLHFIKHINDVGAADDAAMEICKQRQNSISSRRAHASQEKGSNHHMEVT